MRLAHGVEVETACPPELAVITNRELMEQALVNVADNAAKYTLAGRITIEGRAADEGAEIVVTDTGPGIPRSSRPACSTVSTARARAPKASAWDSQPSGPLDALDGRLEVESKVGVGTTVRMHVPRVANLVDP